MRPRANGIRHDPPRGVGVSGRIGNDLLASFGRARFVVPVIVLILVLGMAVWFIRG